jgi:hypothetical protein
VRFAWGSGLWLNPLTGIAQNFFHLSQSESIKIMKTYRIIIPATYTIMVESTNADLALFIGKNSIEESRIYHKGADCENGQVWLGDIEDIECIED